MLEQRRAQKKGYITLKEAANFAGYTPDYVGQLIRAGKIRGEQVYNGVAWMTTKEELQSYLHNKNRSARRVQPAPIDRFIGRIRFALQRYLTLLFVVLFGIAILGMQYAIYLSLSGEDVLHTEAQTAEVAWRE